MLQVGHLEAEPEMGSFSWEWFRKEMLAEEDGRRGGRGAEEEGWALRSSLLQTGFCLTPWRTPQRTHTMGLVPPPRAKEEVLLLMSVSQLPLALSPLCPSRWGQDAISWPRWVPSTEGQPRNEGCCQPLGATACGAEDGVPLALRGAWAGHKLHPPRLGRALFNMLYMKWSLGTKIK